MAVATSLDGPWAFIGSGNPALHVQGGGDNGRTHENFQLLNIDGSYRLLSLDFNPHDPFLYQMAGPGTMDTDWLSWQNGYNLTPLIAKESWNTVDVDNAAYMMDWRNYDGYFYLAYAGNTETSSFGGRGNNTIGFSRSKDLKTWMPAGK
jgi:hypothetical protein